MLLNQYKFSRISRYVHFSIDVNLTMLHGLRKENYLEYKCNIHVHLLNNNRNCTASMWKCENFMCSDYKMVCTVNGETIGDITSS